MQLQDKHKYSMFEIVAGCHFVHLKVRKSFFFFFLLKLGASAPYLLIEILS